MLRETLHPNRKNLDSLTSLRFFAAFAIVLYHAQAQFPFLISIAKEFELEQAVSFFFVLSGFILTYAHKNLGLANAKQYLLSRFWRIYPVHVFALATLFLMIPSHCLPLLKDWQVSLAYLTMTHGWIPIQKFYFSWNSPSWSISAEWFFYISLPALLIIGRKKTLLPILITFCSLVSCYLFVSLTKTPLYSMDFISSHGLLYINPLARIFEFALGISIASAREKIPPTKLPTVFELLTLLLTILVCHLSTKLSGLDLISIPAHFILWASHGGLSALSSALLILVFQQEKGFVSKLLKFQPLVLLGEVSFAMYMLHHIFLCYMVECLPLNKSVPDFALFLLILISTSFFVFSFIETPTRKLFKPARKSDKKPDANASMQNLAKLTSKATLALLAIYLTIPGHQNYQRELTETIPFAIESVNFDRRIELCGVYRSNDAIYFRFRAVKQFLLFERVEFQFLDKDLRTRLFLRQGLTAKPEIIAAGELFDLKIPTCIAILQNSSYMSLKIIRQNGRPLYPQNGTRDDNGTRLLIDIKPMPRTAH
ncbi:MAG: acyltransferase [Candidatus Obscuribacter sp.]|nr:acyltransferase [Candidatus Obscuribacter sp.]